MGKELVEISKSLTNRWGVYDNDRCIMYPNVFFEIHDAEKYLILIQDRNIKSDDIEGALKAGSDICNEQRV